jgi:small subunit ribosomal protein S16
VLDSARPVCYKFPPRSSGEEKALAVRLRLKRTGRRNKAQYRIVATDSRVKRDGKVIEDLGSYDPAAAPESKARLRVDRVHYWISVGAAPSAPVAAILRRAKIPVAAIRSAARARAAE